MAIKKSKLLSAVTIIRHAGDLNHATTQLGQKIERKQSLFIPEWGYSVNCAPYEEHFIYKTDERIKGLPGYMCTCGSAAVVANPEKAKSRLFVCLLHATTGKHAVGL